MSKSTAIASSAAAIPSRVRVVFFLLEDSGARRSSEMQRENRKPSNCRSIWPLQAPCEVVTTVTYRVTPESTSPRPTPRKRRPAWFTLFVNFPPSSLEKYRRVQMCMFFGMDQLLEHIVKDDSVFDTNATEHKRVGSSK